MKLGHYRVIIVALLLSVAYLFGIDYYDKKDITIETLYKCIRLEGITYHPITVEIKGIVGEEQSIEDLAKREDEILSQLSHSPACSKLCKQMHLSYTDTTFTDEGEGRGVIVKNRNSKTTYSTSIKTQKDIHYNTYYNMRIEGLGDLAQLDHLRQRGYRLFEKWHVKPKEYISFTGDIKGHLDEAKKEDYTAQLLYRLKAKPTDYYEQDLDQEVMGYYAYSKEIKESIRDYKGQKTNIQISFTYDELRDITKLIVAFPFYNEPF